MQYNGGVQCSGGVQFSEGVQCSEKVQCSGSVQCSEGVQCSGGVHATGMHRTRMNSTAMSVCNTVQCNGCVQRMLTRTPSRATSPCAEQSMLHSHSPYKNAAPNCNPEPPGGVLGGFRRVGARGLS